jgi:hypothetical protein
MVLMEERDAGREEQCESLRDIGSNTCIVA